MVYQYEEDGTNWGQLLMIGLTIVQGVAGLFFCCIWATALVTLIAAFLIPTPKNTVRRCGFCGTYHR